MEAQAGPDHAAFFSDPMPQKLTTIVRCGAGVEAVEHHVAGPAVGQHQLGPAELGLGRRLGSVNWPDQSLGVG